VRVIGQGRSGRTIVQVGELLADTAAGMKVLMDRIEAKLDGLGHDLVDAHGRVWGETVMLAFEPGAMRRVGTRFRVSYRIDYVAVEG